MNIEDLTLNAWRQLIIKEKITNNDLSDLYDLSLNEIKKIRKKYIPNINEYIDDYLFYEQIFLNLSDKILYSNFCIINLEKAKENGKRFVHDYSSLIYKELFNVEEEIEHQKIIEENNLKGQKYVMPLSGVMLKRFYEAIKNKQVDRKILKNNYFLGYYGTMFFESLIKRIEESNILYLYETGEVYQHPKFRTYQELYNDCNISLREQGKIPKLLEEQNSKAIIPKRAQNKPSKPKDYIKIEKIKIENGDKGQELVYNYEKNKLNNFPELQKKIEKTYLINENAGYDIKSYNEQGNEILIEVKSTKSKSLTKMRFNISAKEDETLKNNKNTFIYYIFDFENPKLRIISHNKYLTMDKKITSYEINQKIE